MADVYLSYASKDQAIARSIAELLEQAGYSVWWDTSLIAGDDYRVTIAREIDRAGAVIAIWSPQSVHSNWVQDEAARGLAADKLIAVRTDAAVEPPHGFGALHTLDAGDRSGILLAVGQRVSPAIPGAAPEMPARPRRRQGLAAVSARQLKLAAVSWAGIIGAVLTIVGNLDAAMKIARLAKVLFERWAEIITWIWRKIIFFRIDILPQDAVLLTTLSILFANLLITSVNRDRYMVSDGRHSANMVLMLAIICALSCWGFATKVADGGGGGLMNHWVELMGLRELYGSWLVPGSLSSLLAVYATCLLLGVVVMFLAFVPIARIWQLRINPQGFSLRLMRIVVGVAIVAGLNFLLVMTEELPWLKDVLG